MDENYSDVVFGLSINGYIGKSFEITEDMVKRSITLA